jgi:hypothetical protein
MTARYEGAAADRTIVDVLTAGEEIGGDVIPAGQVAVVFSYDEVFYLQGTPKALAILLGNAQVRLVNAAGRNHA